MRRPDSFDRRVHSDWRRFRWGDARLMYADLSARIAALEALMPVPHDNRYVTPDELDARMRDCCDNHPLTRADAERLSEALAEELAAIRKAVATISRKVQHMSISVDKLNSDIQTLITGYQAVVAERDALKQALAAADADKAAAVAAEAAADQSSVDAADQVVADFNASQNPAPADGGSGDGGAPADAGDGSGDVTPGEVPPADGSA